MLKSLHSNPWKGFLHLVRIKTTAYRYTQDPSAGSLKLSIVIPVPSPMNCQCFSLSSSSYLIICFITFAALLSIKKLLVLHVDLSLSVLIKISRSTITGLRLGFTVVYGFQPISLVHIQQSYLNIPCLLLA